jgi:hypothetical protein
VIQRWRKHCKRSALYKAKRKIEKAKVRAKVEHPFRVATTAKQVALTRNAPCLAHHEKGHCGEH